MRRYTTPAEVFRVVHAGHDVTEVQVVCAPGLVSPPLMCWTCHEEYNGLPGRATPGGTP